MKIEFFKDGSINGKVVGLILTAIFVIDYQLGFIFKGVREGLQAYGSQMNGFFGLSIGLFWGKQIGQKISDVVGKAWANRIKNGKPKIVEEGEGDA